MSTGLKGQVILNTRPRHQQGELTALLEQQGARVLSFPVIEIVPIENPELAQRLVRHIQQFDILLFVSRNAVDGAFRMLDAQQLASNLSFGVIGTATRRALAKRITHLDHCLIAGEPYNSEALLDADNLQQVAGKRIMIFRGQQGRNVLGEELAARGAEVQYCEVYRRELPQRDLSAFNRLVANTFPTLAIMTSNEGMHNLFELVDADAAERLRQIPWLLISERMRESALKLGHNASIVIAGNASDEGVRQSISEWANQL